MRKSASSVAKDAVTLTISNFMVSVIGVITSMLLARFRTLNEYGTFSQIIMITDLVSTILLLGLPSSVNYFVAKADTEEEKQKFITLYLVLSTLLTALIGGILFICLPLIKSYFNNPYITTFAYIFAIYPWASIMINSLSNVCVVYGKSSKLLLFNVVHAVVNLVILLVAQFLSCNFKIYTAMYMASMLIFAIFAVCWIVKIAHGLKLIIDRKLLKNIFTFAIPIGLASSVGTLNGELDKLIIGKFFTTEQYAIFANAAKTLPVTVLATSLSTVLLPKFVRLLKGGNNEQAVSLWDSSINISFCVMCLIVGGFVVFAPDVMSLFYSEKYVTSDGVAVFRIYTLILLFKSTYWGIVLNALGKTRFIFYSSILTLLLNCIFNIGFYYLFGFTGPAWASLTVINIMAFAQLFVTCSLLKISIVKIFPWKNLGIFILETLLFGCAFYLIKKYLFTTDDRTISILISIGLGIVWALAYLFVNKKTIKCSWKHLSTKEGVEDSVDEETEKA